MTSEYACMISPYMVFRILYEMYHCVSCKSSDVCLVENSEFWFSDRCRSKSDSDGRFEIRILVVVHFLRKCALFPFFIRLRFQSSTNIKPSDQFNPHAFFDFMCIHYLHRMVHWLQYDAISTTTMEPIWLILSARTFCDDANTRNFFGSQLTKFPIGEFLQSKFNRRSFVSSTWQNLAGVWSFVNRIIYVKNNLQESSIIIIGTSTIPGFLFIKRQRSRTE